ncbi:hypothetical protein Acr_29g0006350 [Actinidia rufa]|uniref:Uncharacterized protein n=1 Tax=Actinidia rufa TaxID=165716 RepID=A0A7J0HEE0_9ERIC|nr:hypothetical protein Acr_29g0006350 [Actinidia rufa]
MAPTAGLRGQVRLLLHLRKPMLPSPPPPSPPPPSSPYCPPPPPPAGYVYIPSSPRGLYPIDTYDSDSSLNITPVLIGCGLVGLMAFLVILVVRFKKC